MFNSHFFLSSIRWTLYILDLHLIMEILWKWNSRLSVPGMFEINQWLELLTLVFEGLENQPTPLKGENFICQGSYMASGTECSKNGSWTKLAKPIVLHVKYQRESKMVTKSSVFREQLMKFQASCNGHMGDMTTSPRWSLITVLQGRIQLLAREECETAWRIPLH